MSVHEDRARDLKVFRLMTEIDRQARLKRLDPHTGHAAHIAEVMAACDSQQWAKLALLAGTKPPSEKTRQLVVRRYRERAQSFADVPVEVAS